MTPKKILVCTDFSENSAPALRLAVDYAKAFNAELIMVHVVEASLLPPYVDWAPDEIDRILLRTKESAEGHLAELATQYAKDIPNIRTITAVGSVSGEVVALANRENVDLIVVGTHGRSGVKYLVMGSVARNILKTAHRPILIVEGL